MRVDINEAGGAYQIFVAEDNSTFCVSLLPNDAVGTDDEYLYSFNTYTPFGDALVREETVYNPYQFTGRQYDAESGLYHYRARAYFPDVGRFMQQDPAGMVDGANVYAYVGNDPVNGVDPSGTIRNWILYIDCVRGTIRTWELLHQTANVALRQNILAVFTTLQRCCYKWLGGTPCPIFDYIDRTGLGAYLPRPMWPRIP